VQRFTAPTLLYIVVQFVHIIAKAYRKQFTAYPGFPTGKKPSEAAVLFGNAEIPLYLY
jgi:hypothetical protein